VDVKLPKVMARKKGEEGRLGGVPRKIGSRQIRIGGLCVRFNPDPRYIRSFRFPPRRERRGVVNDRQCRTLKAIETHRQLHADLVGFAAKREEGKGDEAGRDLPGEPGADAMVNRAARLSLPHSHSSFHVLDQSCERKEEGGRRKGEPGTAIACWPLLSGYY